MRSQHLGSNSPSDKHFEAEASRLRRFLEALEEGMREWPAHVWQQRYDEFIERERKEREEALVDKGAEEAGGEERGSQEGQECDGKGS